MNIFIRSFIDLLVTSVPLILFSPLRFNFLNPKFFLCRKTLNLHSCSKTVHLKFHKCFFFLFLAMAWRCPWACSCEILRNTGAYWDWTTSDSSNLQTLSHFCYGSFRKVNINKYFNYNNALYFEASLSV